MPRAQVQLGTLLARLASSPTDEQAWRALYHQMWPFVFAVVYRRLRGDGALAEDASQEVFMRLVRASPFERLLDPEAFRRYVWRVADNVGRTYVRRLVSRRAMERSTSEAEGSKVEAQQSGSADQELDAKDFVRHIVDVASDDRDLLYLVLRGHSLSEIAKATGLTYANAGVRLHRLRARLRKSLFSKESGPV